MANLSPALAEELDLQGAWQGVILLKVPRGTIARRYRFRPGDILLEINDEKVAGAADVEDLMTQTSDRWTVVFRRQGHRVHRVELSR